MKNNIINLLIITLLISCSTHNEINVSSPDGKIGDFITVVRKDKKSGDWFLGSITDENKRNFTIELSFLDKDKIYIAEIYADSEYTHWKTNPQAISTLTNEVDSSTIPQLKLASGGGQAIRFTPKN